MTGGISPEKRLQYRNVPTYDGSMSARRTPTEWASIAEAVVVDVLQSQGAFAPRELEAKAAEQQWSH